MNKTLTTVLSAAFTGTLLAISPADLEKGFLNPPNDAKPHTWWHWMNGNVTKEGITADLEAMHRIGVGGAQIFDAGCNIPAGPLAYNTPEWFDTIKHAATEARRLGIELCLPNCSGWSSSGGPWNPVENSMKQLAWSFTHTKGPSKFKGKLNHAKNSHNFYEDISVIAVPVPEAEKFTMQEAGAVVKNEGFTYTISFPKAYKASGLNVRFDYPHTWKATGKLNVSISDDGVTFKPLMTETLQLAMSGTWDTSLRFYAFDEQVEAKAFRIEFVIPSSIKRFEIHDLALTQKMCIPQLSQKNFKVRMPLTMSTSRTTPDQIVQKNSVIDLTSRMAKDGTLEWDVPAGDWRIIRLGYVSSGRKNHPASKFGIGYEVDKLSAKALDYHFEAYVAKLCKHLGDLAGNVPSGLNNILVDSYEVGSQNWTKGLEKEFEKRTGYSMKPYYPVLAGFVIDSLEESERFLWDFRRVVADMFAENYSGALAKKCHEYGLKLSLEPYGNAPSDNLQYGESVDIPMGEFWSGAGVGRRTPGNARFVASLAHTWGRKYVGMESFTAGPGGGAGRWQMTPYTLKAQGDYVYCEGANRIIYHRFTHQPWVGDKYLPGMTMGQWGMHFDRTQTWWDLGKDWITYQTRCQYLLQEGKIVSDALVYCGESAPNQGGSTDGTTLKPVTLPFGYRWDYCAREILKKLKVVDGKIIAPSGVAYSMLVLPQEKLMSIDMLKVVGKIVEAGGKVVGEVKPSVAPGLVGYPAANAEVAKLADEIWSKGVMMCSPEDALKKLGIEPDFICSENEVGYLHREYENGFDGYFVALPNSQAKSFECSFRVTGRVPELWDAEKGTVVTAPVWRVENGRTYVRLDFRPSGSVFVMFNKPIENDHVVAVDAKVGTFEKVELDEEKHTLEIIKAEYGVFPNGGKADVTEKLNSLVKDGKISVVADNKMCGRDPANMQFKTLVVTYKYDGNLKIVKIPEKEVFSIPAAAEQLDVIPDYYLSANQEGDVSVFAYKPLSLTYKTAKGKEKTVSAKVDSPVAVKGKWDVAFQANRGAPEKAVFDELISWTEHNDNGIKYFSGTATYTKCVTFGRKPMEGEKVMFDLGNVKDFAEVAVNGVKYPVLWKPPFCVDVTDALKKGNGTIDLVVKVTNRWANRLIGDDIMYEDDCEWKNGKAIVKIPDWVKEGKKSPTGRNTFTTWKHWNKTDALLPSGLIGPVRFRSVVEAK